jgi:hypothetical protein
MFEPQSSSLTTGEALALIGCILTIALALLLFATISIR